MHHLKNLQKSKLIQKEKSINFERQQRIDLENKLVNLKDRALHRD